MDCYKYYFYSNKSLILAQMKYDSTNEISQISNKIDGKSIRCKTLSLIDMIAFFFLLFFSNYIQLLIGYLSIFTDNFLQNISFFL